MAVDKSPTESQAWKTPTRLQPGPDGVRPRPETTVPLLGSGAVTGPAAVRQQTPNHGEAGTLNAHHPLDYPAPSRRANATPAMRQATMNGYQLPQYRSSMTSSNQGLSFGSMRRTGGQVPSYGYSLLGDLSVPSFMPSSQPSAYEQPSDMRNHRIGSLSGQNSPLLLK